MAGESTLGYRRRLLKDLQKHSPDWKEIDLHTLHQDALGVAESRIYADAQREADNPTALPMDRLVQVTKIDPVTGLRSFEYKGRRTFISGMKPQSMRVSGMTPRNPGRE
jgi:hypothetical protein